MGETLEQGVARELLEETGLEVRVLDLLEVFDRIFMDPASGNGKPRFHFVIVDYLCERIGGELHAGGDAIDVAFASEIDLQRFQITETATRVLRRAFALSRTRSASAS